MTTTDLVREQGWALPSRTASPGLFASSSSRTGRNRACQRRGRASSTSLAKCTRPRNSSARTAPSPSTAGELLPGPQAVSWLGRLRPEEDDHQPQAFQSGILSCLGSGGSRCPAPELPPPSCSAGVGRTGVFITLSIVLERMRYEGVVDIFQTVKMLRTQRPAMVQTEVRRGGERLASQLSREPQSPRCDVGSRVGGRQCLLLWAGRGLVSSLTKSRLSPELRSVPWIRWGGVHSSPKVTASSWLSQDRNTGTESKPHHWPGGSSPPSHSRWPWNRVLPLLSLKRQSWCHRLLAWGSVCRGRLGSHLFVYKL